MYVQLFKLYIYIYIYIYTEENKVTFYSKLKGTLRNIPSTDKLKLIGDFISIIGRENDKWLSALGKYGIGKCNSNGELLLALYTEFDLIVTNTMFKQKDAHKTTWTHPRSRLYDRLHYHKQTEKHQPRGEPGAENGHCTCPIIDR